MKKRMITVLLICVVSVCAIAGITYGVRIYQHNKLTADVESVSSLNMGYWGGAMESEGMVTNDSAQSIYPDSSQIIKEVYVTEGQEVKEGDPLLAYDVTSLQLSLEVKKLAVQSVTDQLSIANKELEKLKKITPVTVQPEPQPEPEPAFTLPQLVKTGDAYNYISSQAEPYNAGEDGVGSISNPYRYLCAENGFVTGDFINKVVNGELSSDDSGDGAFVLVEIRDGNTKEGSLTASWMISSQTTAGCEDETKWDIMTKQQLAADEGQTVAETVENTSSDSVTTYTPEKLAKEIAKKEQELKKLDLDKRKAELELSNLEESATDGVVHAKINGIVKTVQDKNNLPNDGSAFLVVSGSEGLYVKGDISELMLDQVKVGQTVTATSWQSGLTFEAEITSIDNYPDTNNSYYGEGNQNVSYYAYTAYIKNPDGIQNGEYLSLSIDTSDALDTSSSIYLEMAYVRQEDGRYYVMKDDGGVLKKQYVTTGKIVSGGYAIEITSGLTGDDAIAFPYGKSAKEGVKTRISDSIGY